MRINSTKNGTTIELTKAEMDTLDKASQLLDRIHRNAEGGLHQVASEAVEPFGAVLVCLKTEREHKEQIKAAKAKTTN